MEAKLVRFGKSATAAAAFFLLLGLCHFAYDSAAWTGTRMRKQLQSLGVAHDATAGGQVNVGTSLSWSHTVSGSNRLLVVGVSVAMPGGGDAVITSVTYAGQALASISKQESMNFGAGYAEMFYLVNPPTGANVVVVTTDDSAELIGGSVSFVNVNQTAPFSDLETATDTTTTATATVSSAANHMVVDLVVSGSQVTSSNQTLGWLLNNNNASAAGNAAMSTADGATNVAMSYGVTADTWALIAADITPVGETGPLPATAIEFATTTQSLETWDCSSAVKIRSLPGITTTPIVVSLSAPGFIFYSDSSCTVPVTTTTIAAFQNESPEVYFVAAPPAGAINITAAATGLSSVQQAQTISINWATWQGGAACDGFWSDPDCWAGGSVPVSSSNNLHFDSHCTVNCSPTLDQNVTVGNLMMHPGFTGTITQGTYDFYATWGYYQEAGNFAGGSGSFYIYCCGGFSVTGGAFTATSGETYIGNREVTISGTAVFNANGGTFRYAADGSWSSIDVSGATFNDFIFSSTQYGHMFVEGVVNVNGNLTIDNDSGMGFTACDGNAEIRVSGNVTSLAGDTEHMGQCSNYYVKLKLVGNGVQNLSVTNNALPGEIEIAQGVGGSVNLSDTIDVARWKYTSGTVNAGTSHVRMVLHSFITRQLDSGTMHFNNLTIGNGSAYWPEVPDNGGTTYVDGNLVVAIGSGYMAAEGNLGTSSAIEVGGNVTWNSGSNLLPLRFAGGAAQTYSGTMGSNTGSMTVNKTAGTTVTLNSNFSTADGIVTVSSGTLNLGTRVLNAGTSGGTINIDGANAVINCASGCGAGTACGQGSNRMRCTTLNKLNGGTVVP